MWWRSDDGEECDVAEEGDDEEDVVVGEAVTTKRVMITLDLKTQWKLDVSVRDVY